MSLTRRQFLKRTGLAGLALALGRLIATPEPEPNPLLKQASPGQGEHQQVNTGQTTWSSTNAGLGRLWIMADGEKQYLFCYDESMPYWGKEQGG